jgi:hypothetical protein
MRARASAVIKPFELGKHIARHVGRLPKTQNASASMQAAARRNKAVTPLRRQRNACATSSNAVRDNTLPRSASGVGICTLY